MSENRRSYFRVDDQVSLRYRVIQEDELPSVQKKMDDHSSDLFTAASSFVAESRKRLPLLNKIRSKDPAIARYLDALQNQLNRMAQLFLLQEMDEEDHATQEISISASGIAFITQQALTIDSLLEIRLLLLSSFTGILICGRVVRSEPQIDQGSAVSYHTAVEFLPMNEDDLDLLIKHALDCQAAARRQQRKAAEEIASLSS